MSIIGWKNPGCPLSSTVETPPATPTAFIFPSVLADISKDEAVILLFSPIVTLSFVFSIFISFFNLSINSLLS